MSNKILLICTVGGTSEPVAAAVKGSAPARVIFIVSSESKNAVEGEILPFLELDSIPLSHGQFDYLDISDAQGLENCVKEISSLAAEVAKWQGRGPDYWVRVDITGGTKCMSAALALVARQWKCEFSYIGGSTRNKGGLGTVVSGTEKFLHCANPWNALGYQALEDAVILFDKGNYEATEVTLERYLQRITDSLTKSELGAFKALAHAYLRWELFDHKEAAKNLELVWKSANNLRKLFPATADETLKIIIKHRQFLADLLADKKSKHMLIDLCGNAARCAAKGRYDDAVARLYRVIEAAAQFRLTKEHGMPDSANIPVDKIPQVLLKEWEHKIKNGIVTAALQDDYRLLKALGDGIGNKFDKLDISGKKGTLSARNNSILAHGFDPVEKETFERLWTAALTLAEISEEEIPVFPVMSSSVRK